MHDFMIAMRLPATLTERFLSLIPQQRKQIDRLLGEGRPTSFSLASDRSQCWATMLAESEGEVHAILESFPLREFMHVQVRKLAFSENAPRVFAHISLN
ncbi:MAG: hypothetical protein C4326_06980 [Ignavibacteria bacterium]